MEFKNDFLNSVAQEDVVFQTVVVRTSILGDNYYKVAVFVEDDRFLVDADVLLVPVPGTDGKVKAGIVTAETYMSHVTGLLQSWLMDLFANNMPYDVILVTCGAKLPDPSSGTGTVDDPYVWDNFTNQDEISTTPAANTDIEITGGTLTLTSAGSTSIKYTLDGSDPSGPNGIVYSDPISDLTKDMVIKAQAYGEDKAPSKVATITFINGTDPGTQLKAQITQGDAPVVSALTEFEDNVRIAYEAIKPYAYHKTICAGANDALVPQLAKFFADLCYGDRQLLSSAPYYPVVYENPLEVETKDPIYVALMESGSADAFLTYHSDKTRNGSLYSLGLALATINGSQTPVGNSIDFESSNMMTLPGPNNTSLSLSVRDYLKGLNIATFKLVGDNTGSVIARGINTLRGNVMQADWIIAYVTYMAKVQIATFITSGNVLRNASSYSTIGRILDSLLALFGPTGSGRLNPVINTMPAFTSLPESAGDELIIPNAWKGTFIHQLHRVQITGTLIIPSAS